MSEDYLEKAKDHYQEADETGTASDMRLATAAALIAIAERLESIDNSLASLAEVAAYSKAGERRHKEHIAAEMW